MVPIIVARTPRSEWIPEKIILAAPPRRDFCAKLQPLPAALTPSAAPQRVGGLSPGSTTRRSGLIPRHLRSQQMKNCSRRQCNAHARALLLPRFVCHAENRASAGTTEEARIIASPRSRGRATKAGVAERLGGLELDYKLDLSTY